MECTAIEYTVTFQSTHRLLEADGQSRTHNGLNLNKRYRHRTVFTSCITDSKSDSILQTVKKHGRLDTLTCPICPTTN